MIKNITYTIIIYLILVSISNAQTQENKLHLLLENKEIKLDSVYQKLKSNLSDINKKSLSKSQNDWIKFRNSNCNFKSLKESEGGVISNKLFIDCQIQATEIRIKELTDILVNGF